MSELRAGVRNNMCAYLDATTRNAQHFEGIINFILRSRIYKAVSTYCKAYFPHQRQFWENAVLDKEASPNVIRSSVFGIDIVVSAEHLNRVLEFGDLPGSKFVLNKYLVRGCFQRVGYAGDLHEGVLNKAFLSPQYKYLAHVLQHCLSSRKAGHDELRETIQGAFVALVLNIPFDFSGMIFQHLVENMTTKKDKYLMYARFIQMLINVQAPDLPKSDLEVIPIESMTDTTMNRLLSYKKMEKPRVKRLIGHLADPNYVAPRGKNWRHDDSDSDKENIQIPEDVSDDEDDFDVDTFCDKTIAIATADVANAPPPEVQHEGDEHEESGEDAGDTFRIVSRKRQSVKPSAASPSAKGKGKEKQKKKRTKFNWIPFNEAVGAPSSAPVTTSSAATTTATGSGIPTFTHTSQTPTTQVPPPVHTTTTTVPPVAGSSSSLSNVSLLDQLNALSGFVIKLMADRDAHTKLIQDLSKKVESRDLEIAELRSTVADQAVMITNQALQLVSLKEGSNAQKVLLLTTNRELENQKLQIKALQDANARCKCKAGG